MARIELNISIENPNRWRGMARLFCDKKNGSDWGMINKESGFNVRVGICQDMNGQSCPLPKYPFTLERIICPHEIIRQGEFIIIDKYAQHDPDSKNMYSHFKHVYSTSYALKDYLNSINDKIVSYLFLNSNISRAPIIIDDLTQLNFPVPPESKFNIAMIFQVLN